MTCRFEDEFKGREYPRSCPTCGLGPCKDGYEQVKLTHEQGVRLGFHYVIIDPKGKPELGKQAKWNSLGSGIPSQVLIAMTNKRAKPENDEQIGHSAPEPIPADVYFHIDNFYDTKTRHGKGHDFWIKWCARKSEFPTEPQPKLTSAKSDHPIWETRAQEAVDAAAQSNVGIHWTRVKRAKALDRIEDTLKEAYKWGANNRNYSFDKETELLLHDLIAIIDET